MINKKGDITYERTPEDKKRRKAIPRRDIRRDNHRTRPFNYLVDVLHEIYIYLKERLQMIGFAGFIIGVWMSGYYAQAGLKFESLLSFVLGVVVLNILGTRGNE